jgi:signal peptidase II
LIDISFGLILAWAIGNGIERVFRWYVIDFIGVEYFSVFNLADSFITIGAILYIYYLYKKTSPHPSPLGEKE